MIYEPADEIAKIVEKEMEQLKAMNNVEEEPFYKTNEYNLLRK
ncbi:hypothetical protein [Bacillus cereus]|nr:hypothetical protein [Bacillus cereus]